MFSPAKLNLGLRIVGRRSDGYHLLESLFWPISFGDEIDFKQNAVQQKKPQITINYQWHELAPFQEPALFQGDETLVGQALKALPLPRDFSTFDITVEKKIPIGSGLGGISSNVGTVLRFLLHQNALSPERARVLALQWGADIPFFLSPRPSWITGVGEEISVLKLAPGLEKGLFFILFCFPFPVSTPFLFEELRRGQAPITDSNLFQDFSGLVSKQELLEFLRSTRNDLESVAVQHFPVIGTLLNILRDQDILYAGLSGTGPTCFAVFDDPQKRDKIAQDLFEKIRDLPCRSVLADSYERLGNQL